MDKNSGLSSPMDKSLAFVSAARADIPIRTSLHVCGLCMAVGCYAVRLVAQAVYDHVAIREHESSVV